MHHQNRRKYRNAKCVGIVRRDKNLLVLDLDQTLCDLIPAPDTTEEDYLVLRPHTEFFLTQVYKEYDIVIWSATCMEILELKLKILNLLNHPRFQLLGYVGFKAMVPVKVRRHIKYLTKDLKAIWKMFPQYYAGNTILVDDAKINFHNNPNCGLLIKKFVAKRRLASEDNELLLVMKYLLSIASSYDDFEDINHRKWRRHA